jgi:prophage DNA circulation protein
MTVQPGSRYEQADRKFAVKHFYDIYERILVEEQDGHARVLRESAETLYLLSTLPRPPLPPAEYYTKADEHMPLIAFKFMDDSTRWWEVAEANPQIWYPLDMTPGTYIQVPS